MQTINPKQPFPKYDLEARTMLFSKQVFMYVKQLPRTIPQIEVTKQLVRSAGSIGANYIEANESLSKKDFIMRIKISKKEAKETIYWLHLTEPLQSYEDMKEVLLREATELMKILASILVKSVA